MGNSNKWIVKDADGQILGPYSTDKILQKIESGSFSGDELIAIYPGGDWISISKNPDFYDRLLDVLAGKIDELDAKESEIPMTRETPGGGTKKVRSSASKVDSGISNRDSDTKTPVSSKRQSKKSTSSERCSTKTYRDKPNRSRKRPIESDDIELVDLKSKTQKEVLRRARRPILFAIPFLLIAALLMYSEEQQSERIHLLRIQMNAGTGISAEQAQTQMKIAVEAYLKDDFRNYLTAQDNLVRIVQANKKNLDALALLCMTYFELLPYAYHDGKDLETIEVATRMAKALDPSGANGATCGVVELISENKIPEAKGLVDTVLSEELGQEQIPVVFYYFKAYLLSLSKELRTAVGYLKSAQQLWPQWVRPFSFEAYLRAEINEYGEAARLYRQILNQNPGHNVSKVRLGMLEGQIFRHPEQAQTLIAEGLSNPSEVPAGVISKGYLVLAEVALSSGNQSRALRYAEKSYAANPGNLAAKNLVVKLGGVEKLKTTALKSQQLIIEADQYAREGDCHTAQAHYKTAFEIDPDSAMAAMKAAQCLWKLSFSTEAIEWLDRAIRADDSLIEAYVLMADYYTKRYNFLAAAKILARAQRKAPKSHEVYRGFALVELRRNNPEAAVTFADKALKIYNTDIESHLIASKASMRLQDYRGAYRYAAKAVEYDSNNREAQIVYARALGGIEGIEAGLDYMLNLVNTYPMVIEYRMAYGQMLYEEESYTDAEQVFRQVIQIDESQKQAYIMLSRTLRFRQAVEEALEALLQAAVLDPADAEPLFEAGQLYLDVNRPRDAIVQFERVLTINKSYPRVHYYLGKAYLQMRQPKKALEYANSERKINPNLAEAYLLAAEAHMRMRQYTLCSREYQKAIALRPQGADIYVRIARCYRLAGNLDVAIAMLNQAASKESGNAEIYKEQGAVYEMKGEIENAIEAYNQYFVLNPNAPDRRQIEMRIQAMVGSSI